MRVVRTALLPILVCFALVAPPASGQTGGETEPAPEAALYPLALGNSWTYTTTNRDPENGETLETLEQTNSVQGLVDFAEGRYFYLIEFDIGIWTRNTPTGMDDVECAFDEETNKLIIVESFPYYYRYPVTKGKSYKLFTEDTDEIPQKIIVTAVDEVVETEAGKFKCLCYELREIEGNVLVQRTWISLGVGIVKYEQYENDRTISTSVLKKFKLEPPKAD